MVLTLIIYMLNAEYLMLALAASIYTFCSLVRSLK